MLGSDEGAASRRCPFLAASVLLKDQPGEPRPGQNLGHGRKETGRSQQPGKVR